MPVNSARSKLTQHFSEITIQEIISCGSGSVRLQNATLNNDFGATAIGDIIQSPSNIFQKLIGAPNVGRTTIKELKQLVQVLVSSTLEGYGLEHGSVDLIAQFTVDEDVELECSNVRWIEHSLPGARAGQVALRRAYLGAEVSSDAVMALDSVMSKLSDRQTEVITKRFGFGDEPVQTLEEVGVTFQVTRERVRQIQVDALKKFKLPIIVNALTSHLDKMFTRFWESCSVNDLYIDEGSSEYRKFKNETVAYDLLSVSIVDERFDKFISKRTLKVGGRFYEASTTKKDLGRASKEVKKLIKSDRLPCRSDEIVDAFGQDLGRLILNSPGISSFGELLFESAKRRRGLRTAQLYSLLSETMEIAHIVHIQGSYSSLYPGDDCSARLLIMVMEEAPHLFIKIFEGYWWILNKLPGSFRYLDCDMGGLANSSIPMGRKLELEETSTSEDDGLGVVATIESSFIANGPQTYLDIHNCTNISFGSIAAIIGRYGHFLRLAPMVYGLATHICQPEESVRRTPNSLLTELQCRYFAEAMHAGEGHEAYPCWNTGYEYALSRWAKVEAPPAIFQSLMSVVDPINWPVSEKERNFWIAEKTRSGSYQLGSSCENSIQETLPGLRKVLAATAFCAAVGHKSISWCSANRILGNRTGSHKCIGLLITLVKLGVVEAPKDWRSSHALAENAGVVYMALSHALERNSKATWESEGLSAKFEEYWDDLFTHYGWTAGVEVPSYSEFVLRAGSDSSGKTLEDKINVDDAISYLESIQNLEEIINTAEDLYVE
jgi:hypothetical protein